MNPIDVIILARTKLKSHRIRTGITVAVAGLLFGLIVAVIVVTQGIFTSVDKYSNVGLNDRTILGVSYYPQSNAFEEYNHTTDQDFIAEIEIAYKADVANKKIVAAKYGVPYDAAINDPSPIGIDPITKQKVVTGDGLANAVVQRIAQEKRDALSKKFSINEYLSPYQSATLRSMKMVQPANGALAFMKNGKENQGNVSSNQFEESMAGVGSGATLTVLDGSITTPFITSTNFDVSKGEIPVILPVSDAEKLLKLESLPKDATQAEQRERLQYIRAHVNEATAAFCYRNEASRMLLGQANSQQDALKRTPTAEYVKPTLMYNVPSDSDCGAITVQSDTRSVAEKQAEANQVLYEKELGIWIGEPMQQKVVVRGVGVSGDSGNASTTLSASMLVNSLLSSNLGFGTWSVPKDLFEKLPQTARPDEIFNPDAAGGKYGSMFMGESYLVEFGEKAEARELLDRTGAFTGNFGDVSAYQFGSSTLFIDEARTWVEKGLFWVLLVVGGIAVIILWGIIGRTIADSRRESAVFRAIGATRLDIAGIYGVYAFLLSLRVVVFAFVLGLAVALTADILLTDSATLGAQLAYAAVDTDIRFHFFSIASWYLLVIVGAIILAGMIASIIPIVMGARRNPIGDMRDEG